MPSGQTSSRGHHRRLRILVLHQHYWPEIAATAQILCDLCQDLVAHGHSVSVVCGQPSYRVSGDAPRLPTRELHEGVAIERVWSYTPNLRSIPRRLAHYASYFGSSLAAALRGPAPDICFVMSTPPLLLGVTGTLMRHLRGVPFVYSVQDLYPDVAVHLGVLRGDSGVTHVVGALSKQLYAQAAALVTLSDGMAERLREKGISRERIHVIPNWADTSAVKPTTRENAFARAHGLDDGFVVQYSGNLGLSQGLECVLRAAELLRDKPVKFALVGDGNARGGLVASAQQRGLDNVKFLPAQPRQQLSELLGACDVGLVTMKRELGSDLVPSKLYGIMAASRPVLAAVSASCEVASTVEKGRCGWVVAPEDPEALASAVERARATSSEARQAMGANGRALCLSAYARNVVTARYEELLLATAREV